MINRIEPNMPAGAYQTYSIRAPRATHFRKATCEEFHCDGIQFGWKSLIDESTELGQKQAHYIRKMSGRKFTEQRLPTGVTEFSFSSGQPCFGEHLTRIDRPEHFLVRGGDWRGNPNGTPGRTHKNADDWVEDFGEHQQKLNEQIQKG